MSSATAPRWSTSRRGSSATGPSTASRAACTSRSSRPCRRTCPAGSARRPCASSTTGTSGRSARPRRSRSATSTCSRARRPRRRRTPFLHFNLGSEYCAAGDTQAGAAELTQARQMLAAGGHVGGCAYAPLLFSRLVVALRTEGRLDEAAAVGRRGPGADAGLHRPRPGAGEDRRGARRGRTRPRSSTAACLELGDAPARYGAMVGCGTFLPHLAPGRAASPPR